MFCLLVDWLFYDACQSRSRPRVLISSSKIKRDGTLFTFRCSSGLHQIAYRAGCVAVCLGSDVGGCGCWADAHLTSSLSLEVTGIHGVSGIDECEVSGLEARASGGCFCGAMMVYLTTARKEKGQKNINIQRKPVLIKRRVRATYQEGRGW